MIRRGKISGTLVPRDYAKQYKGEAIVPQEKKKASERIAADIEAFEASGKKIDRLPHDVFGKNYGRPY